MISRALIAGVAVVFLTSDVAFAASAQPIATNTQISFTAEKNYSESTSWSAKQNRFFVGSVTHGTIGTVSVDGQYKQFVNDDKLVSTVGILVDDARNTLWVANSDPGVGTRTSATTQESSLGSRSIMRPRASGWPITISVR